MADIKETWQAAVKSLGDNAHTLFCLKGWDIERLANTQKINGTFKYDSLNDFAAALLECEIQEAQASPDTFPYSGGKFSPEYYRHDYYFHLKIIAELVRMDIDRYGDNAYLVYAVDNMDIDSNNHLLLLQEYNNTLKRKLAANIPFNLEWAKSGVEIEFLYGHRWFKCGFKQMMNEHIAILTSPARPSDPVAVEKIRHPFPPVVL